MKKFFIRKMLIWIPILIMEIVILVISINMLISYMPNGIPNRYDENYYDFGIYEAIFLFTLFLLTYTCYKIVKYIILERKCESTVFSASISYEDKRDSVTTYSIFLVHMTINPNFCQEISTGKILPIDKMLYPEYVYKLNRKVIFKRVTVWEIIESSEFIETYIKESLNKKIIFGNLTFTSINEFLEWLLMDVKKVKRLRKLEHKKIKTILK